MGKYQDVRSIPLVCVLASLDSQLKKRLGKQEWYGRCSFNNLL
jgi:hypothetical protein